MDISSPATVTDARGVLGVEASADRAAVIAAYRRLAMRHHPDRGGDPETMSAINTAAEVLLDEPVEVLVDRPAPAPRASDVIYDNEPPYSLAQALLAFLIVPSLIIGTIMLLVILAL